MYNTQHHDPFASDITVRPRLAERLVMHLLNTSVTAATQLCTDDVHKR